MKILALAGAYPHAGHPFSGIFNERCVAALRELCDHVEVLVPRPYVPPLLSFVPRWKAYAAAAKHEKRNGALVHRPATPVIPRVGAALWTDLAAFFFCRQAGRKMHRRLQFDAIISFDLAAAGGIAWRLSRDLGIPASGWASGEDVRVPRSSSLGRVVIRAIEHLDVIFYQSHELLEKAASLLCIPLERMPSERHLVLPRGIPMPPVLPKVETRNRLRSGWGITDDKVVVLYIGRILRAKGLSELLEAILLAASQDTRVTCVVVGSQPAFDETAAVQKKLDRTPGLRGRVKFLPACSPDQVWEYLCGADIFAFPSHREGSPNSLLEAMAMGVPAVAFAIPAVAEIEAGTGALLKVPPFDSTLFAQAILRLTASPGERLRIGERGRVQVMDRFMMRKNMAVAFRHLVRVVERSRAEPRWSHQFF